MYLIKSPSSLFVHCHNFKINLIHFSVFSGLVGATACLGLLFTVHNVIQLVLSLIILATYVIGRTTASIILLENYFTGVRLIMKQFVKN